MLGIFEDCHRHLRDRSAAGESRADAGVEIGRVNETEREDNTSFKNGLEPG